MRTSTRNRMFNLIPRGLIPWSFSDPSYLDVWHAGYGLTILIPSCAAIGRVLPIGADYQDADRAPAFL